MPYAGDLKPLRVVGETLCPTIELATAVESLAHLDKIALGGGPAIYLRRIDPSLQHLTCISDFDDGAPSERSRFIGAYYRAQLDCLKIIGN
jgi:hypothetical protein